MGVATKLGCMASFRSSRCSVSRAVLAQFGVGTDVESYLSYPITDVDGLQEVEASGFLDSRHMKVVRSALRTGCLYPQRDMSFLLEAESTPRP
jgi:hypothetical protein